MSILDSVQTQLKDAMRAKNKAKLTAIRNIRAGFITAMKETGADTLGDEDCLKVLHRLAKQRRDSIVAYQDAGRDDLASIEKSELEIIEEYLPQLADEKTTRAWVNEAIQSCGASDASQIGRVMGAIMKSHKGEIDGGLANRMAREILAAN